MVKTIFVTGEEYALPEDVQGRDTPYQDLANAIIGFDSFPALKQKYQGDIVWAERILQHGLEEDPRAFSWMASLVANTLDVPLELRLGAHKPQMLGVMLRRGGIIARGDLGEGIGASMRGGYLFVEGNVDSIRKQERGIIYVDGDVEELSQIYSPHAIVIVSGRVHNSVGGGYLNKAMPTSPSPFVFSSHPVQLFGHQGYRGRKTPKRLSTVVDSSDLVGWKPEDVVRKALALCKKGLRRDFEIKRNKVRFLSADTIGDFFEKEVEGYTHGYGRGYSQGSMDATPSNPWD